MRANITVVGLGKRMKGVSPKTGNAYDFQSVSFLFDDKWTTGRRAATCMVQGVDIDAVGGQLMIDADYDVVYHTIKDAVYIDAVLSMA